MKLKTAFLIGLAIGVVETLIFAMLVFAGKPEPSVSIALVFIVPFLFGLNIILGLYYYLRKLKQIATVVFVNSVVSPVIFYFIWTAWYSGFADRNYSQYSFGIGSNKFEILLSESDNDFSIEDITNQRNGTTTELYYGKYQIKGDSILMVSFEHKMFILNRKLYNFPRDSGAIVLQKTN
jgi:hypothetical protein